MADEPTTPTESTTPSAREAVAAALDKVGAGEADTLADLKTPDESSQDTEASDADKTSTEAAGGGADANPSGGPARDPETGKFVAKDAAEGDDREVKKAEKPEGDKGKAEDTKAAETDKADKEKIGDAPRRFAKAAKEKWADVPEEVRAEVKRAFTELEEGIGHKEAALKPYEGLQKHAQLAKDNGITLSEALDQYVMFATALEKDPKQALANIASSYGHDINQLFGGQKPGTDQQPQPAARRDNPELTALRKEVRELRQGQNDSAIKQSQDYVERFASDHEDFEAYQAPILELIQGGATQDLNEAYSLAKHPRYHELKQEAAGLMRAGVAQTATKAFEMATRLNPGASDSSPQKPDGGSNPTAQSAAPGGEPVTGSDPDQRKPASQETRDLLEHRLRQQGL